MSKRIVIVSGGQLDEELTLSILKDEKSQCIIGVDKGMEFLYAHQIMPSYIVGDFDSVNEEIADYYRNETNVPIREFNPVSYARVQRTDYSGRHRRKDRPPLGQRADPYHSIQGRGGCKDYGQPEYDPPDRGR